MCSRRIFIPRTICSLCWRGSSYYLCDQAGTLLYAHEAVAHEDEQLQPYVNGLVQRIQEGSLDPYDATITGPDGNPCGVYYYQMSNGWITILTIPFRTVLRELTGIYRLFYCSLPCF